jgi:hypothetical protein
MTRLPFPPLEVARTLVAPGVWRVKFADGTTGYLVDGTAAWWKMTGRERK